MCDRTFQTASASQPACNDYQLAYNDYQLNHQLHQLATMGSQNLAQQQAAQVEHNQVDGLRLAVRELEKTRTAQARELDELKREKSQIGSTLGTTLIACFGILAFYADPESWKEEWSAISRSWNDSPAVADSGARARSMMQNLKETE